MMSNEMETQENMKVHYIVLANHKVKLHDMSDTLEISKQRVGFILHEHLSGRQLSLKWGPYLLMLDQSQQCGDYSESCLEVFGRDRTNFLHRYLTMN